MNKISNDLIKLKLLYDIGIEEELITSTDTCWGPNYRLSSIVKHDLTKHRVKWNLVYKPNTRLLRIQELVPMILC